MPKMSEIQRQRSEHQADQGADKENPLRDYPVHPVTGQRISAEEHARFSAMTPEEREELRKATTAHA